MTGKQKEYLYSKQKVKNTVIFILFAEAIKSTPNAMLPENAGEKSLILKLYLNRNAFLLQKEDVNQISDLQTINKNTPSDIEERYSQALKFVEALWNKQVASAITSARAEKSITNSQLKTPEPFPNPWSR